MNKTGLEGILNRKSTHLWPFSLSLLPEPYLFKVVSQKDKVDTAESQLRDNQEKVHDVPEGEEGRNTKIMIIKSETPREMGVWTVLLSQSSQALPIKWQGGVCPGEKKNYARCHHSGALREGKGGAIWVISEVPFLACLERCRSDKFKIVMARGEHKPGPLRAPWPPPPHGPPVPSHAICSKAI